MLYEDQELPELHFMKHRHDNNSDYVAYESNILDKRLSPNIYNSKLMAGYLDLLAPLVSNLFDRMNIMKNWNNYIVDKYYYKHPR